LGFLVARGGPNYGIDFKGGSLIQVQFKGSPPLAEIRRVFGNEPQLGGVEIKRYGEIKNNEVLIGVQKSTEIASTVEAVSGVLEKAFSGEYEIRREEAVGPKIGNELKWKALLSIFVSLFAIVLYIWLRFQFRFGIAAIAALFHDVTITLGVFSVLNLEVSLPIIAAFLTIIGYSLNDTIVVFDRIRENLFSEKKLSILDIINKSINQSLGRTVVTSVTTLFAVTSLYFLGVSVIKDLAFALIIGVIVGTYSSVGVASALIAAWSPEALKQKKRG